MQRTFSVLDHLDERAFRVTVRRLADALGGESCAIPAHAGGAEPAHSRPYHPGEPVTAIDWRVTARTGRAFVRGYEPPGRMPVYLLPDSSASMSEGTGPTNKYAWAVQLAAALALVAVRRASPVGLIAGGERHNLDARPSLSPPQVFPWLHRLRRAEPDEESALARGLRRAERVMTTRSLLVVLTDLHDPDAPDALDRLARRHDVVVLQLQDGADAGGWVRPPVEHVLLPIDEPFLPRLRAFLARRGCLGRLAP